MTHLLVTGGGRGIGRALCLAALARGWQVTATVRRDGAAPQAVREIRLDMGTLAGLEELADRIGPVDVLVNNAGVMGPAAPAGGPLDPAAFLDTFRINTLAPLAVTQALRPCLAAGGRVLFLSSQMSWMGYAKSDHIAYRASKAALNKVVQGLATDLAPDGIAVAAIDPGWVRTDMGGPEAELDPGPVAGGILDIAATLDLARTGRFLRHDGTLREY